MQPLLVFICVFCSCHCPSLIDASGQCLHFPQPSSPHSRHSFLPFTSLIHVYCFICCPNHDIWLLIKRSVPSLSWAMSAAAVHALTHVRFPPQWCSPSLHLHQPACSEISRDSQSSGSPTPAPALPPSCSSQHCAHQRSLIQWGAALQNSQNVGSRASAWTCRAGPFQGGAPLTTPTGTVKASSQGWTRWTCPFYFIKCWERKTAVHYFLPSRLPSCQIKNLIQQDHFSISQALRNI